MRAYRAVSAALALAAMTTFAAAQDYPTRPITVVSPFSAGNANDIVARVVLDEVVKQFGQPLVFENRPGAGGAVGVSQVARAKPDGYTILIHSSSFSASRVLQKTLPYDMLNDFLPTAMFGAQPSVLITGPTTGIKSVADLVKLAKAKSGSLNFASAGVGAASHMAAERFNAATGIKAQHIPFKGPVEAMTEVMAGRIQYYFLPISPAMGAIGAGKVVPLAVSTPTRAPALPDVPTTKEAGYPAAAYLFWSGIFLPAKTPAAIADKLHAESNKALARADVQQRLAKLGVQPISMTRAQFDAYFREDVNSTVQLAKDIGLKPQE
jgi:tripartite-type tricarboxylate transporter receptor subunit TctC